jgi:CO/xanthine dehydrogenase Mo-binding subunit
MDVPEIDVIWTSIPDTRAPMGARDISEIGITGVGAVANAVYNATGTRARDLPHHPRQAARHQPLSSWSVQPVGFESRILRQH